MDDSCWLNEGEYFCTTCKPDGAIDVGDTEQDSPANCCVCHQPLPYSLTTAGVRYVLRTLRDTLACAKDWNIRGTVAGGWYDGLPTYANLADWALHLKNYYLTESDGDLVRAFLAVTSAFDHFGAVRASYEAQMEVLRREIALLKNENNEAQPVLKLMRKAARTAEIELPQPRRRVRRLLATEPQPG